jgi:hypothetical protein
MMGRRDYSEYVYIARAYMNADKPDFKAIQTLTSLMKEMLKSLKYC